MNGERASSASSAGPAPSARPLTTDAVLASASLSARWHEESLRLHKRYQIEVVEACGLCPWAIRSRLDGKVRTVAVLHKDDSLEASLETILALNADPNVEVALILYPRMKISRPDFDHFTARVRESDARRQPLGKIPFVMAAFHPQAKPDVTAAERLVPFLRRSPDPSIQLLRSTVLDRIRGDAPQGTQFFDTLKFDPKMLRPSPMPLREKVARANLAIALKMGVTELSALEDEIIRDRNETYLALEALEEAGPTP